MVSRMRARFTLVVAALLGLASPASVRSPAAVIDAGPVQGTTTSLPGAPATVNKFLGLPFAQSPLERFSPPAPPKSFKGVYSATAFTPSCTQQFNYPEASRNFTMLVFNSAMPPESEDCLYLNVYAPSTPPPPQGRAVLFWIYGGGLQFGTAMQPSYDGSMLAAYQDVIVVALFRHTVFGFPSSPELPLTGQNLGFLDQRTALNWVQRNIKAFGGDPSQVTIFGESAGGTSVDALLTSFPANSTPPFRAGIMESGQLSYTTTPSNSSVPTWNQLVTALNCTGPQNLTCMRQLPAETIKHVAEHQALSFNPVPDEVTMVSNPAARRLAGQIANLPVLIGSNAQEARVLEVGQNDTTALLQTYFGSDPALLQQVQNAYQLGQDGLNTPYDVISQISTEIQVLCPTAVYANASSSVGIPTWRYYFNASFPDIQPAPGLGVYHTSEIPLVFGSYMLANPLIVPTAQEYALSQFMQGAWAHFAKEPTAGPGWNAVGSGSSFNGGAADLDLGVLGNVNSQLGGSGVTVIPESTVDYRCPLYDGLYSAASGVQISS